METDLVLSGVGFPPFSARGCVQELMPIMAEGLFQRTVNGELVYLGREEDVKYRTVIKCQDKDTPAFAHLWRGSLVTVSCVQPLLQPVAGEVAWLSRPAVAGSVQVFNKDNQPVNFKMEGQDIAVKETGGYVSFRPILSMSLVDFSLTHNEWGAKAGWSLTLEEV